jgi:hypothetical protein
MNSLLRWEQTFTDPRVGDAALVREMETPVIATGWSETSKYGFGGRRVFEGYGSIGHGLEGRIEPLEKNLEWTCSWQIKQERRPT